MNHVFVLLIDFWWSKLSNSNNGVCCSDKIYLSRQTSKYGSAILKYTVLIRSIWYKTSITYVHTVFGIFIYLYSRMGYVQQIRIVYRIGNLLNDEKEDGD